MRIAAALLAALASSLLLSGDEGKLQAVRQAARDPSPPASGRQSPTDQDETDDAGNDLRDRIFEQIIVAPYALPHILLNDDYAVSGYFLPYPFAHDQRGYMLIDPTESFHFHHESTQPDLFADASPWMVRLALEESNDFDGLNRLNGHLLLDTTYRLGLQASWSYLHERLEGNRADDSQLGDVNLVYRFAQNKWVQVRSGLGVRIMTDNHATHYGWNFNYSGDLFPIKPLILSTSLDVGTLGEAWVVRARQTAGVSFREWEMYLGYDFLRIGSTNLQGPVIGLRYWY